MGMGTRHKKKFYAAHPLCIFCGGIRPSETIEHCPPRALFQNRAWPVGFEFPSCEDCNLGSSDEDLLVTMLARSCWTSKDDGAFQGIVAKADQRYPGIIKRMVRSSMEARQENRRLGITPPPGETHKQQLVKLPPEYHEAMTVFSRKLAKGIYYLETGSIFPNDGALLLHWFTNEVLINNDRYPAFNLMKDLGGKTPPVMRGNRFLNDQFSYRTNVSPELDIFTVEASFTSAFGLMIFGSRNPGQMEGIVENLRTTTGKDGPFVVIQSVLAPRMPVS
jgi:hypothetical protein